RVGHHLDAGDDEHARVALLRAGDLGEEALGAAAEDGALLARDACERAERRQPILDAKEIVLAQEDGADAGLFGERGQLVEREVARLERGVDVEKRREPFDLRGPRRGDTAEAEQRDRRLAHLATAHPGTHRSHGPDIAFSRTSASYTARI